MSTANITLSYHGAAADGSEVDFYDVAQALQGFQRVLALTSHFALTGEVITKATAQKGASFLILPAETGSLKFPTKWIMGATGAVAIAVGTASPGSLFHFAAISLLDYVIKDSLGISVDLNEPFLQQFERAKGEGRISHRITEERIDDLKAQCEPSLIKMHRPIVFSETAKNAQIDFNCGSERGTFGGYLNSQTFSYISTKFRRDDIRRYCGVISSFNRNTYRGRIYIKELQRTIPFELSETCRDMRYLSMIAGSLYEGATSEGRFKDRICFDGFAEGIC
jgi:hypothetical protein